MASVRCDTAADCGDAKTCPEGTAHEVRGVCPFRRYCTHTGVYISCEEYAASIPSAPITNLESNIKSIVTSTSLTTDEKVSKILEEIST